MFISKAREITVFLAAAFALLAAVFGDALLGRSLLAPVDIAPALWKEFAFVNPASDGVPRNQHLVDQLGYDLPLQHLMHEAWRRGEVPWWNPYSFGGRPLLADAHCNGSDPLRVAVYLAVPDFVLAYNWTRAAHWLWGALGLFLLLRRAGNPPLLAGLLALAGEVAGWKMQTFGHPWVEGALCWYPWLWLALDAMWMRSSRRAVCGGALCVAAIFYAGNVQSHACLPLFVLAVVWGWCGWSWRLWWRACATVAMPLFAGAMLAAPVLAPQLELFMLNVRPLAPDARAWPVWNGPLAFAAAHPWLLGTPRTGAFMALGVGAFGFALWAGSAVLPLAAFGMRAAADERDAAFRRTALALVAGYVVVVATPLYTLLYARYAGLAVFGLLILAGRGARSVRVSRAQAVALAVAVIAVLISGDVLGRVLYPRVQDRYARKLHERLASDGYGGRSARLREAQVAAVPSELSQTNPEVAAGIIALAGAALVMLTRARTRPVAWAAVLVLNLGAPLLHTRRFVPRCGVEEWSRLLAGSAVQQRIASQLAPSHGRIEEAIATTDVPLLPGDGYAAHFPQEFGSLHRVRTVHGYSALVPRNAFWSGSAPRADALLRPGAGAAEPGIARFFFESGSSDAAVEMETLNTVIVRLPHAQGGVLVRMDTPFPGWKAAEAANGNPLAARNAGVTSEILVPPGVARVRFDYRPRGLSETLAFAAVGALVLAVIWFRTKRAEKNLMTA